jgi:hypothetical protein
MAVGALLVIGMLAYPLAFKIRAKRASERAEAEARFSVTITRARASFSDAMGEVIALEERDPELGSEARLSIVVLAKKVEDIQREVAANAAKKTHPIVVERLARITEDLERVTHELKEARPKKKLTILE